MKNAIIILFSILVFSCIQKNKEPIISQLDLKDSKVLNHSENNEIITFLKEFYHLYISENAKNNVDRKYILQLKEKYVSKELLEKLGNENLDYDPFVNAQDYNIDWLQNIQITQVDNKDSTYLISILDNQVKKEIYVAVKKQDNAYRIISIEQLKIVKVLDIQVYQQIVDLNGDGIKDKIEVYEDQNGNDDFEKKHFNLTLKIYKGTNDSFTEWVSNNHIIFPTNSNCIAEGFDQIKTKNNFFTVEQNLCSNYISISSYITFKILGDEIFLYKYGEEYFDKADHDREIPTKIWTTKDFGKVKFEDLTEDFFYNLRSEQPIK